MHTYLHRSNCGKPEEAQTEAIRRNDKAKIRIQKGLQMKDLRQSTKYQVPSTKYQCHSGLTPTNVEALIMNK